MQEQGKTDGRQQAGCSTDSGGHPGREIVDNIGNGTSRRDGRIAGNEKDDPFRNTGNESIEDKQVFPVTLVTEFIDDTNADTVQPLLAQCHPLLCDILPLSLEEVFIYELGGVDYEVKDILL